MFGFIIISVCHWEGLVADFCSKQLKQLWEGTQTGSVTLSSCLLMFVDHQCSSVFFHLKQLIFQLIFFAIVFVNKINTSHNLIWNLFEAGRWGWFVYLCAGWWAAGGCPCGRQPWGPAHRSADWACSAGAALSAAALWMHPADALGTGEQPHCAQTQEPDTCMCYQPDSNDTPPPAERTGDLKNLICISFTFRIMQQLQACNICCNLNTITYNILPFLLHAFALKWLF